MMLVAIGASVGGPTALATILGGLPETFPAAIVVVQHLGEDLARGMAEWLDEQTPLRVRVTKEGDRPAVGTVGLAATSDHLVLKAPERFGYTPDPYDYVYRPSVDALFESIVKHWRGDAIGVLLTGMGRDGARGLKMLRDGGQYTIAQDERTSVVYGMPKAAVTLDAAVAVLPIEGIAGRLMTLCEAV